MLSYVLYGRNDSYGYNLHKRAALSLNCMAEVLSDPDDEILFVDYNTPDDFPTFPEAIQDTLTDKAKKHLRVFRVRPAVHARFGSKTYLFALEPVSRNVAIRRSNPANRWILSTNTDMVFVPQRGKSLSEIVSNLPKGHYGIPRFEVPETLWESPRPARRRRCYRTVRTVGMAVPSQRNRYRPGAVPLRRSRRFPIDDFATIYSRITVFTRRCCSVGMSTPTSLSG